MMQLFKKHEPRSLQTPDLLEHYMADIVYGANDGIITTFAIISGVQGAKLSALVVLVLGFVNLFADGISMGASRYLSIRAGASAKGITRGFLEPLNHSLVTFFAFFIFGLFPLLSYIIPDVGTARFAISCILTAITLFIVGSLRFFVSHKGWFRGGFEMLILGGVVAAVAYFVGFIVKAVT